VFLGLVFGKQIGVMLASWITVRLNLASLPSGTTWLQLYGVSWLAAIGFTMSLFIASLAFNDATSLAAAKVGVLGASLVAGIVGFALLRWKS
jgi:NhaA family Na+:H+ antiporter